MSPSTLHRVIDTHPLIEDALARWAESLSAARDAYRGHAYRVFNVAHRLVGSTLHDEALAVASAFHDLGIWSDGTFDYLPPSIARAAEFARERTPDVDSPLVARMIDNHHLLFPYREPPDAAIVEAFRKADLVDVSAGMYRAGLDREFLRELTIAFPYAGFHGAITRAASSWFVTHPSRPLPMVRFRPSERG
jgi:hypothetical protein